MGTKGQSTATTQANPVASSYIQNALAQGANAAQLPFNIPQAPVAGFSQDQLNAFNTVNNAQGMAQPYINQAQNYFNQGTQPNVSQFFNPYASAVTQQLENTQGEQMSQVTGNLTQAAGGVGADRIAVGQSDLANQQNLATGQTMASLFQPSLTAAQQQENIQQGAGYGTAALGQEAQNAALSGAQAQLGTGGLQQQLSQAQLNSPYQQQVAQAMFPYQQANFYAGLVGSLAPGLGGTTTSTPAQPSIWSQLLGAGAVGAGVYGGLNGSNSGTGKGGTSGTGIGATSMNGQLSLPQNVPGFRMANARGGAIPGYDGGGTVSDKPIDISQIGGGMSSPFGGAQNLHPMHTNFPQAPTQQNNSNTSASNAGQLAQMGLKLATMFANRGGAIHPYASGGNVDMKKFDGHNPYSFFKHRFPKGYDDGGDVTDPTADQGPFRLDSSAYGDWQKGVTADTAAGQTATPVSNPDLPQVIKTGDSKKGDQADDTQILAFSGGNSPSSTATPGTSDTASPYAADLSPAPGHSHDRSGFMDSPWAALAAAGLGMMSSGSPFPGVAIGQGGMQGLKMLQQQQEDQRKDETTEQAARRLEQEAKFHEDSFTRETTAQKNAREQADRPYNQITKEQDIQNQRQAEQDKLAREKFERPYNELTAEQKALLEESRRQHDLARIPQGYEADPDKPGALRPIAGGPHTPDQIKAEADAKRLPAMSREDMAPLVDAYIAGDRSVMNGIGRGVQGPANIQQMWGMIAERLRAQGADGKQLAAAKADFMGQQAALRTAEQRAATVTSAVNEANNTFPQVEKASAALPRTDYPLINTMIQSYRDQTGSPEQRQFKAAIQAAVTAYSQAIARTGGNSVWAQQHAEALLKGVDGHDALMATLKQLRTEMEIAKNAPEETRQEILNHILGVKGQGASGAASAGNSAQTPATTIPPQAVQQLKEGQITTFGNGQKWTLKNGQPQQVQ